MIGYAEALGIIRREASNIRPATEIIDLSSIRGRICAGDITSPLGIPPFDSAAMDGFALQAADAAKKLKIKASVAAGDVVSGMEILSGECCEIMTGASIPHGADSIIPVEQAKRDGNAVSFLAVAGAGDHIRKAGSDFTVGATIVKAGDLLGTRHVLPLASLGIGRVKVYSKTKIAFIPTGSELVGFGRKLNEGQIYNSNLPYAQAFLAEAGAEVFPQETIADDPARFQSTIRKLMNEDIGLILSSGAVSAGSRDFIRGSLEEIGATVLFHKVAIKPGKPILFAKLPNGALYFGLPGNPVSTAAGLRFFVQPFLAALTNQPPEQFAPARAKTPLSRKPGLRLFLKANISVSPEGILDVALLDGQESYKTAPFLAMNGWAVIPEDRQTVDINDIIETFPLTLFSGAA